MAWDGTERRMQDHRNGNVICKQEDKINLICDTMIRTEGRLEKLDLRINGSLEKMAVHFEDSTYWRRFIMGVAVSLVVSIMGGILTVALVAYNLGEYTRQIKTNTVRIDVIEDCHKKDNSIITQRGR